MGAQKVNVATKKTYSLKKLAKRPTTSVTVSLTLTLVLTSLLLSKPNVVLESNDNLEL